MNNQMLAVMQRRGELLAKIDAQRQQLGKTGASWQAPLAMADRGINIVRFLHSHPVLVAGIVTLLVIRRHGMVGLIRGGWRAWKGYRYFVTLSEKLSPRNQVP